MESSTNAWQFTRRLPACDHFLSAIVNKLGRLGAVNGKMPPSGHLASQRLHTRLNKDLNYKVLSHTRLSRGLRYPPLVRIHDLKSFVTKRRMWLLTTDRAELVLYREPPEVYAILSHVWRAEEQSFQELFAIIQECKAAGENPRDYVDDKIRKCCQWAEAHGFKLLWMDSCCIDKSSSAELSEAINSMFMWYKQATVCYAYLRDALAQESPSRPGSSFRQSKWFTRGWTLQELIAPRDVVFLSGNWQPLASKITAARLLEEITGIEAAVLRGRRSLDEVNVAKRMSWAAKRVTTRIEDQAYCLMGIFGVNLPTIYGEGSEAFIRLQEEIIRRTPDRTLLAWGPRHPLAEVVVGYRSSIFPTPQGERYIRESCLLARSPSEFASAGKMVSVPIQSLADTFGISVQRAPLTASSYGAHTMFPVIQFPNHCTLALLPCQEDGAFVALVLRFQGTNGPWSVGTRAHRSETLHVRSQYSPPTTSRTRSPEVITHTREYPVRCVLIRDLNDLVWCMQHPLRQTETIPTPIWSPIFVAYRAQHVMVRSQLQLPKTWSRKSYVAPCKLIIPVWALTALEDVGYTLRTPLPSSFLDLVPGQMLSLVFSTPVAPGRWSAFAVHIGAEQPASESPRGLARRGSGGRPQTPLWCAVRFPRPERGGRSVVEQAQEWIGRELTASPPAPFVGLDMSDPAVALAVSRGHIDLWREQWSRLYVDGWANGWKEFDGLTTGVHLGLRFTRLCDLHTRGDRVAHHHGIQEICMVDIALLHRVGQRAMTTNGPWDDDRDSLVVPDSDDGSAPARPLLWNSEHHS